MRRRRSQLVVLVTLATVLVVSSVTTGSAGNEAKAKPKVTLSDTAPVTVTGSGFLPRERVTVRLSVGSDTFSRKPRATAKGRFAVQFEGATVQECSRSAIIVLATGNRSGRSATTRVRRIQIPPPCGFAPQP